MAKVLKSWTKKVGVYAVIKISSNGYLRSSFLIIPLTHWLRSQWVPPFTPLINQGYEYDPVHFLCFPFFATSAPSQLLKIPKPTLTLLYAQCALRTSLTSEYWTMDIIGHINRTCQIQTHSGGENEKPVPYVWVTFRIVP